MCISVYICICGIYRSIFDAAIYRGLYTYLMLLRALMVLPRLLSPPVITVLAVLAVLRMLYLFGELLLGASSRVHVLIDTFTSCMRVYPCKRVYIRLIVCMFMYIDMKVYMYIYICMYACIFKFAYIYIRLYVSCISYTVIITFYAQVKPRIRSRACGFTSKHTYKHAHTYSYVCIQK